MSYAQQFRAFARRHGVSDDAITRILWSVQPGVEVGLCDPEGIGPESQVIGYCGGLPRLPADTPWPMGDTFIAALDLAAIPPQPMDLALPRQGHLLFFGDPYPEHDCPAEVIHVPAGTPTAERPAPVDEEWPSVEAEVLPRQVITLDRVNRWDILGWTPEPDNDDVDDDEKEWLARLMAAIEEYGARVGEVPTVQRRTWGLRGEALNPNPYAADYRAGFLRRGEEAVTILRAEPERFDELHGQALEAAALGDGVWLNLLEFHQDEISPGDGEMGWIIRRDDLHAGRFDRVRQSQHS
ncbi:DUF1963 domain-containing protein [Micromonospora sp. DT233]|uniref:DUF1963 domain-containing protein n=1 Tax=Micromonospora sp. DT233 TaxID=3393432 RepID=UPI003CEB1F1D